MKICIIVDGSNVIDQLQASLAENDMEFLLVHTTEDGYMKIGPPKNQEIFQLTYNGDMEALRSDIDAIIGIREVLFVMSGKRSGVSLANSLGGQFALHMLNEKGFYLTESTHFDRSLLEKIKNIGLLMQEQFFLPGKSQGLQLAVTPPRICKSDEKLNKCNSSLSEEDLSEGEYTSSSEFTSFLDSSKNSVRSWLSFGFWRTQQDSPATSPERPTPEKSEVKELLERLSKGWSKRAGVRRYDSSETELPTFDLNYDDFLEELLPFHHHPIYLNAESSVKKAILTRGWIIYNKKTIAIESDVVTPACLEIINGKVPGLEDRHSKQLAAESLVDESYHTLLVTRAIGITEEERRVFLDIPSFSLVRNLKKAQEDYHEPWKKMLILLATAIVSEIFISDYLKLLSESKTVQPFNREVVSAHRTDELNHSKIFKAFAKALYAALTPEQQLFFSEVLPKPIYWFADKELDAWEKILQEMHFAGAKEMIDDCRKEQSYHIEYIDYSGLEALADELGIEHFREIMYPDRKVTV